MDRECVNSYCAEYRTKSGENINTRMILLRGKKYHNVLKYEPQLGEGREKQKTRYFNKSATHKMD